MIQTQTTDAPASTFGQRLQRCRKAQRIGAEKLADMVNAEYGEGTTTRGKITLIETGRKVEGVTLAETLRYAHVLGVSPLCLIIDLEQPFLPADFPGFEGLRNYQALRRFNGYMGFHMTVPDCMEKAARICCLLEAARDERARALMKLATLRHVEMQQDNATRRGVPEDLNLPPAFGLPLSAKELDDCVWGLRTAWRGFTEHRSELLEQGVIIPDAGTDALGAIAAEFAEANVTRLDSIIQSYLEDPPKWSEDASSRDMPSWGDLL
ncbi:hypothetical protein G1C96_1917 [Bifidobacterium sp. DSM 109958]|uniref:Uncharacterized protein n=1 Tax=Bifidobacterium moraviense TaxID=2675323 RepID=A0A7Y0I0C5_9BIFI|nr:helix-turn-helix transcriptional regulator [Bifidobacterium sp. DSM 109958]NMN01328.1 hypothetical protein [Bifidobacterium sp. DSM 109958]